MLLTAAISLLTLSTAAAATIADLLQQARADGVYRAPSRTELTQAEALFQRTLGGGQGDELRDAWRALGMELHVVQEHEKTFVILLEQATQKTGRGFYLVRPTASRPIALQAPHSFKDQYTGQLALRLLAEGNFAAIAWNTVPRSYRNNGVKVDADLAHLKHSYFQAFTRAFGTHYPDGLLVQLHGFSRDKRKTAAGWQADVILSSGSRSPTRNVLRIGHCLKRQITDETVLIYPQDVRELGATTNSSAQALRQMGHRGFLHVEMNKQMRLRMHNDATIRRHFLHCLP